MKNKKRIKRLLLVVIILLTILIISLLVGLSPVSKDRKVIEFTVKPGTSKLDILKNLEKEKIIKNNEVATIYLLLTGYKDMQAGKYNIDISKNAKEIIKQIQNGELNEIEETITVTFVEGLRITDYAKVISDEFGYKYDDVIDVFKDKKYTKELISKYSMLDDTILDDRIYYPLEGYLYPDTYEFYKNASIKDIIEKLLNNMSSKLESLSILVDESDYSVHEILTMASIAEKEANTGKDRQAVAQVVYTRLNKDISLGMDVTSYYGVQKSLKEELTKSDLADKNGYNTRPLDFIGLPVGAICSPSLSSINAVLNPSKTEYFFFFADINTGKVSFFLESEYDKFLDMKHSS